MIHHGFKHATIIVLYIFCVYRYQEEIYVVIYKSQFVHVNLGRSYSIYTPFPSESTQSTEIEGNMLSKKISGMLLHSGIIVERLGPRVTSQRRDFHLSVLFFSFFTFCPHQSTSPPLLYSYSLRNQPKTPNIFPTHFPYDWSQVYHIWFISNTLRVEGHCVYACLPISAHWYAYMLSSDCNQAKGPVPHSSHESYPSYQPYFTRTSPQNQYSSQNTKNMQWPPHDIPYSFPLTPPGLHTGPDSSRLILQNIPFYYHHFIILDIIS